MDGNRDVDTDRNMDSHTDVDFDMDTGRANSRCDSTSAGHHRTANRDRAAANHYRYPTDA